ncbi:hypothetical protein [Pectinatus frisingensis]|uniref:hypothetical protein n=1 Tax=Pectinatus frisingensis TaxID=865 RepID=UPI0018C4E7E0|nr:hypothetical protein [Pectinatus frisingensis]
MKKSEEIVIHVKRLDEGKKRTFEEQMQAIKGISIEDFIKQIKQNAGGKYDSIFLPDKSS